MQVRSNSLEGVPGVTKLKVSLHRVLKWTCATNTLNSLVKYLFLAPDMDSHISSHAKPQWLTTLSMYCITSGGGVIVWCSAALESKDERIASKMATTADVHIKLCQWSFIWIINPVCNHPPEGQLWGLQNNWSFVWPEKSTGTIVLKTYSAPLFTLAVNPHFHWRLTGL